MGKKKYLFLISSERSGTNLFIRMMDSHSLISGPLPSHLIRVFYQNIHRYGDLGEDKNWSNLSLDVCDVLSNQLGVWETKITLEEILNLPERSLESIIAFVYSKESKGKPYVFIKENHAYKFYDSLVKTYPEAKFIHLVRDPRDVAASWKKSPNHPGGVIKAAELWNEDQAKTLGLYSAVFLLKYEDLVSNPVASLKQVCKYVGVGFEENMLRYHADTVTQQNAGRVENWKNLTKAVMSNNFGKYQSALSASEIAAIESICGSTMKKLGYELEGSAYSKEDREKVEQIESRLSNKLSDLSAEEKAIREKRLEVIYRIIDRDK